MSPAFFPVSKTCGRQVDVLLLPPRFYTFDKWWVRRWCFQKEYALVHHVPCASKIAIWSTPWCINTSTPHAWRCRPSVLLISDSFSFPTLIFWVGLSHRSAKRPWDLDIFLAAEDRIVYFYGAGDCTCLTDWVSTLFRSLGLTSAATFQDLLFQIWNILDHVLHSVPSLNHRLVDLCPAFFLLSLRVPQYLRMFSLCVLSDAGPHVIHETGFLLFSKINHVPQHERLCALSLQTSWVPPYVLVKLRGVWTTIMWPEKV